MFWYNLYPSFTLHLYYSLTKIFKTDTLSFTVDVYKYKVIGKVYHFIVWCRSALGFLDPTEGCMMSNSLTRCLLIINGFQFCISVVLLKYCKCLNLFFMVYSRGYPYTTHNIKWSLFLMFWQVYLHRKFYTRDLFLEFS